MHTPDHSRNHTARPGHHLNDVVDLPGWDHQSIWGWDDGVGSFYAQLWRNNTNSDAPEIWLSGATNTYPWPGCIALEIATKARVDPLTVVRAMGIAHPQPRLLADRKLADRLKEMGPTGDSPYVSGHSHALAWTLGHAATTPGGGAPSRGKPTPEQADAEHHMVTGRVYLGGAQGRDYFGGADEALWWALGRSS
ncbi:hypothetical protein GCM10010123_01870 [Pilimelia anulata]|uniref:Uncharacterized protein n=1 Tax=Pilimelia anulata TaxID=53371 RepID=A0A8J3FAL0_9ACTN|nr:hypothetical protein [Pilimelia anulata]GGJ75516.1 hypothetical protein GCM10010123_01870 [Pilimelia anulata]